MGVLILKARDYQHESGTEDLRSHCDQQTGPYDPNLFWSPTKLGLLDYSPGCAANL
jgi:hypothetical protein